MDSENEPQICQKKNERWEYTQQTSMNRTLGMVHGGSTNTGFSNFAGFSDGFSVSFTMPTVFWPSMRISQSQFSTGSNDFLLDP